MVPCPAALDLPHAFVERVTMLIVAASSDRPRVRCSLWHSCADKPLAQLAAGFRISVGIAHTYVTLSSNTSRTRRRAC